MKPVLRPIFKMATMAGLVGLVVLHPEPFAKVIESTFAVFGKAIKLGTPDGRTTTTTPPRPPTRTASAGGGGGGAW